MFSTSRPNALSGFARNFAIALMVLSAYLIGTVRADDQLMLRDICRLKGLEENTLQGLGLVVGLKGTGDGKMKPTARALARTMQLMGSSAPTCLALYTRIRRLQPVLQPPAAH